jgi:hypothetical protein
VTTRRRLPLLLSALVAVAALVGASCSTVAPTALTVDGFSLSERDFMDQLESIAANQAYLDARAAQGSPVVPEGTNGATFSTAFTSQYLNERVSFVLAEQENEARGLEVTEADRRNAELLLSLNLSPNPGAGDASTADPEGLAVLDGFATSYRDALVEGVANVLVLRRDILDRASTEDGLRALYEAQADELGEQACVSHILIRAGTGQAPPTPEELAAARERVDAVADQLQGTANFAALAATSSEDPGSAGNGGDLGCAPQGSYIEAFDAAVWSQPVGEVGEPVETDFGYHLILVTKRGQLTFEDLRDQLSAAVEENSDALLNDWLRTAASEADVTVGPRFGRWAAEEGRVVPPQGAQSPVGAELDPALAELLGGGAPVGG